MVSSKKRKAKKSAAKASKLRLALTIFLVFLAFSLVGLIFWSTAAIRQIILEERHAERLANSISFCESLFDESTAMREETIPEDLTECDALLTESANPEEEEQVVNLHQQVADAFKYLAWIGNANEHIDENNIVKDSTTEEDLVALTENAQKVATPYQNIVTEKLDYIRSEYDKMRDAKERVNNLFTSVDLASVRQNVVRSEYNDAKNHVEDLRQEGLKQNLSEALDRVLPVVEEQERIARERAEAARRAREEEQRKIASSWSRLDISPYYINQFTSDVKNGCEAASLLMALKYKGYIRGANFRSFALGMPTSETDPNQGFYLSMTDLEPRNEAHWIAPAPLANYGVAASSAPVINVSGWSLDQLDNEVKNGNPVVIYLTYGFKDPKEYSKGVPRNLHVLVLSGFNSYTGEQQFYDPWPISGQNPSLSKARTEYLYAASGHRALVVR